MLKIIGVIIVMIGNLIVNFFENVIINGINIPGINILPIKYHISIIEEKNNTKKTEIKPTIGNEILVQISSSYFFVILQKKSLPIVMELINPIESIVDIIVDSNPTKKIPLINGGRIFNPI